MAFINIAGIVEDSIVDGIGYRYTIFVQGCPHHCKGCHNPKTHAFHTGKNVDTKVILADIKKNPLLDGVTFSGGEPFSQSTPLLQLAKEIKKIPLTLWIYTGYTYEELLAKNKPDIKELLSLADVLVDGRFILSQRNLNLYFRGSTNQRLIDLNLTRKEGKIVLLPLN